MINIERKIIESKPIQFLIETSKKIILPGFEKLPLYDVLKFFIKQTQEIGLNERAASIAFNFLMAVPPFFIFIFTLLSNMPGSKRLYDEVLIIVKTVMPDESTFLIIKDVMDDFFLPGTGLLSFGLLLALYFSSNATLTIMRTFTKSMLHIEVEKRNFIELRWDAIKLTMLIVLLVFATIFILLTQTIVVNWLLDRIHIKDYFSDLILNIIQILIIFLLIFVAIGMIYRYAPNVQKKWKVRSPGAILATILVMAFTYLFSYWVNNIASYNKVYGSIGSILILMFLVFVNSLVLLIGFELNVSINSLKSIAAKRKKHHHYDEET
jgi:membrane protein